MCSQGKNNKGTIAVVVSLPRLIMKTQLDLFLKVSTDFKQMACGTRRDTCWH
jgi:hypothetical protein